MSASYEGTKVRLIPRYWLQPLQNGNTLTSICMADGVKIKFVDKKTGQLIEKRFRAGAVISQSDGVITYFEGEVLPFIEDIL